MIIVKLILTRALFCFALLLAAPAHGVGILTSMAQNVHLSGMMDISFGTTLADAQDTMLERDGVMLDLINTNKNNLVCDGGTFAGKNVDFWVFGFVDDQMHTAKAIIDPEKEQVLATYKDLLRRFSAIYGEPTVEVAYFDDPYEHGDGFETYAISFGKGHFAAIWKFTDGDNENAIAISIDKDLYIPVIYQSGELIDLALAKQQSASLSGS